MDDLSLLTTLNTMANNFNPHDENITILNPLQAEQIDCENFKQLCREYVQNRHEPNQWCKEYVRCRLKSSVNNGNDNHYKLLTVDDTD